MSVSKMLWVWILAGVVGAAPASARPGHDDAAPGTCRVSDSLVLAGPSDSGAVALTFDACPTRRAPGFSPEILATLQREHVPATAFVSGRWAEAHASALQALTATPDLEVALHGHRHRHLNGATAAAIAAEIEAGRQALLGLGVTPVPFFRPPYGEHPAALAAAARLAGVTPVLWDVAPGDPDPQVTAAGIERSVLGQARAGSIVVLHINGRGVGTAAALPVVIAGLRARGLQFVSLSDLLRRCPPAAEDAHAARH